MEGMLRNKKMILLFVGPALLMYLLILFVPIVCSIYYSFFKWNLISPMKFIGLDHYIRMFTWDDVFPITIRNVLVILFVSVTFQQVFGFMLAVILTRKIKGRNFFRNIIFMPAVFSSVAIGLIWTFIYNPKIGIINTMLRAIGLDNMTKSWLSDPKVAIWSIGIVAIWQYAGYSMILYSAAIQNIPNSINESAIIDGATPWKQIRYITLPLIKPIIRINIVLACIGSLKFFDLVYAMTGGGPSRATEVLASYIYSRAFTQFQYGYGNALSVVLFAICLVVTVFIYKVFRVEDIQY